jgi:hypothetical protein
VAVLAGLFDDEEEEEDEDDEDEDDDDEDDEDEDDDAAREKCNKYLTSISAYNKKAYYYDTFIIDKDDKLLSHQQLDSKDYCSQEDFNMIFKCFLEKNLEFKLSNFPIKPSSGNPTQSDPSPLFSSSSELPYKHKLIK